MPKKIDNIEEKLLYILVWAVVFLIPILNFFMLPDDGLHLIELLLAWLKILPFFIIFLIHSMFLLPLFALKRRYIIYLALTSGVIGVTFGVVKFFDLAFMADVYLVDLNGDKVTGSLLFTYLDFFWNSLLSLAMCAANYVIKLIYESMSNEKAIAELNRRRVEAEMEQLKHQINPHFFMNTLNNIHALVDIDTELAKGAIIELSKMFRHLVYESGGKNIRLSDDIRFAESYINLMKLRYEQGELTINFDYPKAKISKISVPPLVLIIFIENAFKHGVRGNRNSIIDIKIEVAQKRLLYRVENSIGGRNTHSQKVGIGLDNLRKRLDLLYKNNYILKIEKVNNHHIVELNIPITDET
ncbi:MAG: histidine kinase [Rikenellaceae bacterium]